jgi:hypothetical protein
MHGNQNEDPNQAKKTGNRDTILERERARRSGGNIS